jgi:hypothetical protein
MQTIKVALLLWIIAAAPSPGVAAQQNAVATMTGVRGLVEVRSRGEKPWRKVRETRQLFEGDALRVGRGGRTTLFQPGCPARVLKEGDRLVVSASKRWLTGVSAQPLPAARHRSLLQLLSSTARSSRSQPTAVRPQQADTDLLLSPRGETVMDGRPTFAWREYAVGHRYQLDLYRDAVEEPIWNTESLAARVSYPEDRPPLAPGRYQWQVYVNAPAGRLLAVDGAPFTVPDAATSQRIRADLESARALLPDGSTSNLPLVAALVTHRLYSAAETELQRGLALTPEDTELRRLLAHVHTLMGR